MATHVHAPIFLGTPGKITVHQSDISSWAKCPLLYKYERLDGLPRLQSGSLTFGTIIHDCVLWMEVHQDVETAIERFHFYWEDPTRLDARERIDYYVRGTNWRKFKEQGPRILRNWWSIIQWDTALVLGREFTFDVPVGDGHRLRGTIDKLEVRFFPKIGSYVVLVSDYKTNKKTPTYGYLEENLQFSAYCYATTLLTFWLQLAQHLGLPEAQGIELYEKYKDLPRRGEWVSLPEPKRMDAGERVERHYNRFQMAVDALALSVEHRIFVPNISGETCRYCDYRDVCGLPIIEEDE